MADQGDEKRPWPPEPLQVWPYHQAKPREELSPEPAAPQVTPAAPPAQQPAAPEAAPVQETTPAAAAALPPAEAPPAQLPPGEPPARKTGLHRRAAEQAVSGAQIRAQRLARGWTQAELAQRVRLSRPFIALVEQGRRILAPDDLSRVREALGL